jgi:hypothetical protein
MQGRGSFRPNYPEVMWPAEIRAYNAAVAALEANGHQRPWAVCWLKFVFQSSIRKAATIMQVNSANVHEARLFANAWLAARLDRPTEIRRQA